MKTFDSMIQAIITTHRGGDKTGAGNLALVLAKSLVHNGMNRFDADKKISAAIRAAA